MEKDGVVIPEGEQEEENATETPESDTEGKDEYRGKLNATNRFLEKEGYTFKNGKWVKPEPIKKEPIKSEEGKDDFVLSRSDERALIKADIEEEDESEVLDYARLKKISVSDALKTSLVKGLIAEKKQERATALATQTKGGNKGQTKVTGETILAQAKQGQMPDENDAEGIARLAEAEWEAKNKKR